MNGTRIEGWSGTLRKYRSMQHAKLVEDLNHLYRSKKALYELDDAPEGFEWINSISGNDCYLAYRRKSDKPERR